MKTRSGFVSNSSSSSFVIPFKDITAEQLYKIMNHAEVGAEMELDYAKEWSWDIETNENSVIGSTFMNNFSMEKFLSEIGVADDVIKWNE